MQGRDISRQPCPDRIVEDMGGAFGMGSVGGFLWHFIAGAKNSPRGLILKNALYTASSKSPVLGGNFAIWGGTFSTFDCTFQALRNKEDHWNAIFSGFVTGGVLALRGGLKNASRNAFIGGVLLSKSLSPTIFIGIIETVSIVVNKRIAVTPRQHFQRQMEYEKQLKNRDVNFTPTAHPT